MNPVTQVIRETIDRNDVSYVFPSEIAASVWAGKALEITGREAVALARFTAWDRFKETAVRTRMQTRVPVSAALRKLFAEDLLKRNADAAMTRGTESASARVPVTLPFQSIIPLEYAADGSLFTGWTARVLPSLALWKRTRSDGRANADAEDGDFAVLESEYSRFLEGNGLFEPAWEKPPLHTGGRTWYVFFPEAIEDFAEYEEILSHTPDVILIRESPADIVPVTLERFGTSREEIRAAADAILEVRDTYGIPWREIAVSIPGLEELEPYVLREFALKNIPVRYRSGKVLADYSAGSLFSLFKACTSDNFSFASLKALLLNSQFPWKFPELNEQLIRFGIANNCVSSYSENGRLVDVWESALRAAPGEERLLTYYTRLRQSVRSIVSSESFSDMRARYFAFRSREEFFDETRFTQEADAVLARCIEELSALILLERDYPALTPRDPFSFYLSVLKEKIYVPQKPGTGVNVFPYRVAAGTPFTFHVVLNASQNAASVLYQPLLFLRQDKRATLGIRDTDASDTFFSLYSLTPADEDNPLARAGEPAVRTFCSDRTFTGYAIPHSHFLRNTERADELPPDAFGRERAWFAENEGNAAAEHAASAADVGFPERLFPVQKLGFRKWESLIGLRLRGGKPFSILRAPFPHTPAASAASAASAAVLLAARMREKQYTTDGKDLLRISATDMNDFYTCPTYWLYRKILKIEDFSLEAKLLDDTSLGNLYHEILKNLFERIKAEHTAFASEKLDTYRTWARDLTFRAAREYPAFQGPLAAPLIESQAESISERIGRFLETEATFLDGFIVGPLEQWFTREENGVRLNGKIDRISFSSDGSEAFIIDYKTGATPAKADCIESAESPLADFQIPMYLKLYEGSSPPAKADGAFFMSILKREITMIVGSLRNARTNREKQGCTREEYDKTLEAFETCLAHFRESVERLDFVPPPGTIPASCRECEYRNICRTTFSLSGGA